MVDVGGRILSGVPGAPGGRVADRCRRAADHGPGGRPARSPTRILSENGWEFIRKALTSWWKEVGSEPIPVEAGSPWQNGFIESFQNRLRDEFLERVEFATVSDAVAKAKWHRREYNTIRPHSSLGYKTPKEFSAQCDEKRSGKEPCEITDRPANKR